MKTTGTRSIGIAVLAAVVLGAMAAQAVAAPSYQGYTFCASGAYGYLLDPSGTVVHTWHASGSAQTCAYLLPDGSALFPIQNSNCTQPHHDGAYPSGRFQKIAWDGTLLWDYRFCDTTTRAGYDVHPMPNGNILIPTDASNVAKIFEVQPTGSTSGVIVWQCALPDSLTGANTYMNSVAYNPELDMIVIDMQEPQRKVVLIDHSVPGGRVLKTYRVPGSGRVHAATWVHKYFLGTATVMPDHDAAAMRLNNLLVVHNGGNRVAEFVRETGTMTTIYYNFQDHEGSVQRLPNGNTLVCRGGSPSITEIDDAAQVVATMSAPGQIQRAYRYGPAYPGLSQLWPNGVTDQPVFAEPVRFAYNRAAETGNVSLEGPDRGPITARVYTVDGRLVRDVFSQESTASFSTSGLPAGIYFLRVGHAGGGTRTKFLIVR